MVKGKTKKSTTETRPDNFEGTIEIRVLAPESEYSEQFLQRMLTKMGSSYNKYGPIETAYPERVNALATLERDLLWYFVTRNKAYLADAANYAMIEFLQPSIDHFMFAATDSDASPGRTIVGGEITSEKNTDQEMTMQRPDSSKKLLLKVNAPESEYSVKFLQGMIDRMTVSYFKYGMVSDAYPSKVNAAQSMFQRIEKYLETGNSEFLIDVANFAMIEFMYPSIIGVFYDPGFDKSQPGRVAIDGTVTFGSNA